MTHCANGHSLEGDDIEDTEDAELAHASWQQALVHFINDRNESLSDLMETCDVEDDEDVAVCEAMVGDDLICDLAQYTYHNYSIPFLPPDPEGGLETLLQPIADALHIDLSQLASMTFYDVMTHIMQRHLEIRLEQLEWHAHIMREQATDALIKYPSDVSPFIKLKDLPEWKNK